MHQVTAGMHDATTALDGSRRIGHRGGGHRGSFASGRGRGHIAADGAAAAAAASASGAAAAAAIAAAALLALVALEEVGQKATALPLAAAVAAAVARIASRLFAARGLLAASRLFAARGLLAAVRLAALVAAIKQALQPAEQAQLFTAAARRLAARLLLAARRLAARLLLAASRFTASRLLTAGRLAATCFAALSLTAAITPAQHAVQEVEPEALATQTHADNECSYKHVPFHRATSPLHGNWGGAHDQN